MAALELKIPPLVVVVIVAAAMWGLAAALPSLAMDFAARLPLAIGLAAAGILIVLICGAAFFRTKTSVMPHDPGRASALVCTGLYRFSRNPMYLGMLLVLLGWALFLAHPAAALLLPLYVIYMNRFQIIPEERALAAKFGAAFAEYRKRVRRWL